MELLEEYEQDYSLVGDKEEREEETENKKQESIAWEVYSDELNELDAEGRAIDVKLNSNDGKYAETPEQLVCFMKHMFRMFCMFCMFLY